MTTATKSIVQPNWINGILGTQPIMQLMNVSPALATEWLESKGQNRTISQKHVSTLARSMKLGLWRVTGDTIKLDANQCVRDGQHRLWAIVESGCTIQTWVTFGINEEAFDVIDTGRSRRASDVLSIHQFSSAMALAAACRMLIIWEQTGVASTNAHASRIPSNPEILAYASAHPDVQVGVNRAGKVYRGGIPGGRGMWAALLTAFARIDDMSAEMFTDRVADGTNLSGGDPILLLRNRLIEQRGAK
jgi:hypothetical protein